ncbi:hypothetical protein F5887DRAFT_439647 [Amanita rubescens]|nr:hypothetical protein F5887DRAFT_439647 [Amanita rubescens]
MEPWYYDDRIVSIEALHNISPVHHQIKLTIPEGQSAQVYSIPPEVQSVPFLFLLHLLCTVRGIGLARSWKAEWECFSLHSSWRIYASYTEQPTSITAYVSDKYRRSPPAPAFLHILSYHHHQRILNGGSSDHRSRHHRSECQRARKNISTTGIAPISSACALRLFSTSHLNNISKQLQTPTHTIITSCYIGHDEHFLNIIPTLS